jgi:hypothetical protein
MKIINYLCRFIYIYIYYNYKIIIKYIVFFVVFISESVTRLTAKNQHSAIFLISLFPRLIYQRLPTSPYTLHPIKIHREI